MKKKSARSVSIPYRPFVFFLIFLTSLLLLSYFSFSVEVQLWLFLLGILLPFIVALNGASLANPKDKPLHLTETLPTIPSWTWLLPIGAGAGLLFYQFNHLRWPIPDEGLLSYFSMELARHWTWHYFFSIAQHPPAFNWLLGLYFKVITPSLFSLWLFPVLLAVLTTAIVFCAIRKHFSDSFSLFLFFLFSASLWPLFTARFCSPWSIAFLWEILVLSLLLLFMDAPANKRFWPALALGITAGFGFFVTIPWIFVALPLFFALYFGYTRGKKTSPWKPLTPFFLPLSFLVVLFIFLSVVEKNGDHIRFLMAFHKDHGFVRQIADWVGYVTSLFWGIPDGTIFRPVWGGMLNPLLGSLFFLGLVETWRSRKSLWVRWLLIALASCWIPAVLSRVVEVFRVLLTVPFLFFIIAMGFQSLVRSLAPRFKTGMALLIVVSSFGLDFHHVQKYLDDRYVLSDSDCQDLFQTYRTLATIQDKRGPGAFLANIGPNMETQNPVIATYPFNASYNFRIPFENCRWVAMLVSDNYKPFLASRFPNAAWFILGKDHFWYDGNHALVVIPIEKNEHAVLEKWFEADRLLQPITLKILYAREHTAQKPLMDDLYQTYEKIKDDRFLASTLVERMLFYKQNDGTPPTPLDLVQRGLKDGYPLRNFYKVEAVLLDQQGKHAEAKQAYLKASKPNGPK